uniref:RB1-inducible coiled-coil protein 1 n=1 Tax=Callorhinchus milii TaxID=7868 RepID=A0A4W3JZ02_CALMI
MKLYVFLVNTGTTLTFDTELAVQTVADLKHAIQAKYKIATQHQVLVVNGGECMVADRRVCNYSAGTDTNPIFLYNKEMILCDRAPTIPKTTFSAENEMGLKVEESLMMPAVFHTVASRTQLAVEMYEVAKKLCAFCERLVHDEHLQHQGWAAIMANLEDCTYSFQKLLTKFEHAYNHYEHSVEDIKLKLTSLGTAVSVMAKIPLLECLTRHSYRECQERLRLPGEETEAERFNSSLLYEAKSIVGKKSPSSTLTSYGHPEQDNVFQQSGEDKDVNEEKTPNAAGDEFNVGDQVFFNVSLLDWINVQDRPNDVESLVRKCFDSMNRLDPGILQPFLLECHETIAKLDNQNMKAIKGLEDRLYALDQMIASCNRLVNEQKELAQGFLANQKRAENLKDPSVLPDLCLSHANQLMIMLTNHKKLVDIKQKCTTAKQELANNLQVRLKWCCYVMLHADQNGEKLQALLRLLTELQERVRVVEALSTVPQMYCLAVVEVVRRKMFTKHYREWASALVKEGKQLYEAERTKRESFGKLFRRSFLRNRLFKGLDSWPASSFCTRKPRKFDFELPDISLSDLQFLQTCCPPEVQPFLRVPTLCDFEPLNQHIQVLRNLVKAAQSLDEMSQTITDLLTEQKASLDQAELKGATTQRSESTTGTKTTSSRASSTLSLQGPICPPANVPASLEELSPDSIDAHTFDFETIAHPNLEQALKQESIDMDSLAESPESDFMSAVNEFVIEENLASPNVISDPQSPEMMVESLYSSVINAIDNRRMQDTAVGEKEDSKEVASLKVYIEKYRFIAEMSQSHFISIKEDLSHFRSLVQEEQYDFNTSMKNVTQELRHIIETVKCRVETETKENYQRILETLRKDYDDRIDKGKVHEKEQELNELKMKVSELSDLRCKLEVEMALKEAETEEIRQLFEENQSQQQETIKCQVMKEVESYTKEINGLKRQQQVQTEEYKVGLAEQRTLMTLEKNQCVSELVDRQDEEMTLLRAELIKLDTIRQQALNVEAGLKEQIGELNNTLEERLKTIEKQREEMISEKEREDKEQLLHSLQQDKETVRTVMHSTSEECVQKSHEEELEVLSAAPISRSPSSLIADLTGKFEEEKASLLEQLEKRNEELQNLKTSLIAEQQTNFNTVLTREKMKKEQIINELSEQLKKLTQQQEKDRVLIESLSADRATLLQEKKKLDEELNRLRSNALVSSTIFSSPGPSGIEAAASTTDLLFDPERLASVATIMEEGKIDSAMEASTMTLQMKEEENKRLNQRLVIGDLVLIILDERHDNYVLFTVGPTLYFLHSESLGALDLKPGSSRRPWVLGKVMEKEYCQAKKAQNRFKVPLGTKFYRVKAVPWNKKV